MLDKVDYSGTIVVVTPDGRSGVVRLDEWVDGTDLAVIAPETAGRVRLMNGAGVLPKIRVHGTAIRGPDALKALTVESDK